MLAEEVALLAANSAYDYPIPVIIEVNREFFARNEGATSYPKNRTAVERGNALSLINSYTARLTATQIKQLLTSEVVEYITIDAVIRPHGRPDNNSASNPYVDAIGAPSANALGYTGEGIGVAVFDSGVKTHFDLFKRVKIIDFTSGGPLPHKPGDEDLYGHGTHVAGIIAGDGHESDGAYRGVAPKAQILSVRVINAVGQGLTSNLVKAIDWVIQNKAAYWGS